MNRLLSFVFCCLLFCLSISAQQEDKSGLRAFRVLVPEEQIVQGDRVQIVYELEATNYSIRSFSGGVECGQVEKLDTEKSDIGGVLRIRVTATFRIFGAGKLKVIPMRALVDGKEVYSDEAEIDVAPNPKYGRQWLIAYDFLKEKGVSSPLLSYKYGSETICAFSDDKNECFVITVSESYSRYVDKPVLSYATGNSMWNGERTDRDNTIYAILSQYNRQLKYLRDRNEVYSANSLTDIAVNPRGVTPLLRAIEYGQDYPYNMLFPKEKYEGKDSCCIAGCGPVALAQLLSYYQNPVELNDFSVLTTKSGKRYKIDMSTYPVKWNESKRDLANLMLNCAGSVSAELSPYGTSSSLGNFKSALIDYWGYSPQCRMIKNSNDHDALSLIYREIDNKRPVIVSDDSHIFVCDGYSQDYLHYNLGWNGHCNGYYRAIVIPTMDDNQLPFNMFLMGIRPLEKELEISVDVTEPGTLSMLLDETVQNSVTSLAVTGKINGDDIRFLRKIAGAGADGDDIGSLMKLDLSGARIIGGSNYLVRSADGIVLKGYQRDASGSFSYNYNMSEITDDDWTEITRRELFKLDHVTLLKAEDGLYYASYQTVDDVISEHMFSDCENLTEIILPKNIKKIDSYAFHNCKALKIVENRPETVNKTAFQNSGINK